MSFRARLTSFFVLIVVIPMLAVGFLVFRLINDSEQGKADARASGLASAAGSLYQSESIAATADAQTIARALSASATGAGVSVGALRGKVAQLASTAGLARVVVTVGHTTVADVGDPTSVAPGVAIISGRGITVTASELTAAQYARSLASPGSAVVVRQGSATLASTLPPAARDQTFPQRGSVTVEGQSYRAVTQGFRGFGPSSVDVTVLSSLSAATGSVTGSRVIAAAFIAAFLVLAFWFSVLASRGLQGQISRFLQAARRLAGGDFSSPVQIQGNDEFAALGQEFNNMSVQLEHRLEELSQERGRLRVAISRIGQTFASNLDRPALLELALKTAIDAGQASAGRVTARSVPDDPLSEVMREGSLTGLDRAVYDAERSALGARDLGESTDGGWALSVPLVPLEPGGRIHGLITVVRRERPFSNDDRALLRSLGAQATLALDNVDLHVQVSRQAVTDELTGLANHGRFQELLGYEVEQVRRYHHPLGLIMLDIDDFKAINDTHGHQQGDVVLKRVARVLEDNSREVDYPARYGGEEMALILPHTDLEGTYAIAERIRTAIEALRVPNRNGSAPLRITASLGVVASGEAQKDELIAEADAALYEAKRQGKNRTVRAPVGAANVLGAG